MILLIILITIFSISIIYIIYSAMNLLKERDAVKMFKLVIKLLKL